MLVGSAVGGTRPAAATPRTIIRPLRFDILIDDRVVGNHRVDFDGFGSDLLVETRIEIEVKLLFLTLFAYSHRSAETWKGDRLDAFASTTEDNGRRDTVVGRARGPAFEVTGRRGTALAPGDVMVGSFWNPAIVSHTLLIDPQKGTLKEQVVHDRDRTVLSVDGAPRPVTRYRLTSVLDGDVFYDDQGRWVGATFDKRGTRIHYRPRG
ncbi:MAG: DUF6134 family protein [Rhodospirillales bacterium]